MPVAQGAQVGSSSMNSDNQSDDSGRHTVIMPVAQGAQVGSSSMNSDNPIR